MPVVDLAALGDGSHLCRFYDDERDLARGAASFVACGLAAGDRVLYLTGDRAAEKVEASLQVHGVDVERALAGGQLVLQSFAQVYGPGMPHLQQVEDDYRALHARAVADGLAGLRVAAEMGDAVGHFGSLEHLLHWEDLATDWIRDIGVSAVCQYDRQQFSGADLDLLAAKHTAHAPAHARRPLAGFYVESTGLRIVGEVDISNADRLLRVVESRLTVQPRLPLDLTRLTFVDVPTLERLFRLVQLRPRCELLLHNASPLVRRCLEMTGLQHPRVVLS